MRPEEIRAVFDQQAAGYDKQWVKLSPIREGLHFLLESVFADLPTDARVLCVGVGTGAELAYLAKKFRYWSFTALDPSGAMIDQCRLRAENEGFVSRCCFRVGYVDSLPIEDLYDAATCFLVSQFILDRGARSELFRSIAVRLRSGGLLASSDLASRVGTDEHEALVRAWMSMMAAAGIPPEGLERMRAAWEKDLSMLPPTEVASIIQAGGFEPPAQFFQAGLIHAWFSKRASAGLEGIADDRCAERRLGRS